jgi:hypothetical protein
MKLLQLKCVLSFVFLLSCMLQVVFGVPHVHVDKQGITAAWHPLWKRLDARQVDPDSVPDPPECTTTDANADLGDQAVDNPSSQCVSKRLR